MKISEASVADIPALFVLINSAYRGDGSKKGWTTEADLFDNIRIDESALRQYLEDENSVILKAENDGQQLAGCVYLKREQDDIYLGLLSVSPDSQANGTGRLLLYASEEKAKQSGCRRIVMTVISTRSELLDWYERRGYRKTGQTKPFASDDRFGMPKLPLEFLVLEKTV